MVELLKKISLEHYH